MSREALHRLVVNGDVCGSGSLGLRAKLRMRERMYDVFEGAFTKAGVRGDGLHMEDRGDGVLAALAPQVPSARLVGPWLGEVYQRLRHVNEGSAEPLRMRIAMHAGQVVQDERGLAGRAVDLTCRLCDSAVAKQTIERADGAPLLVVVSDALYRDVVAEGGRYVEPEHYRQARVSEKETDEEAWFHVPPLPFPPLPPVNRPGITGEHADEDPAPERGDGAAEGGVPSPASGADGTSGTYTKYNFEHIGGNNQIYDSNTFHGSFTGIRQERGSRDADTGSGE